jgi:hypothetical protein
MLAGAHEDGGRRQRTRRRRARLGLRPRSAGNTRARRNQWLTRTGENLTRARRGYLLRGTCRLGRHGGRFRSYRLGGLRRRSGDGRRNRASGRQRRTQGRRRFRGCRGGLRMGVNGRLRRSRGRRGRRGHRCRGAHRRRHDRSGSHGGCHRRNRDARYDNRRRQRGRHGRTDSRGSLHDRGRRRGRRSHHRGLRRGVEVATAQIGVRIVFYPVADDIGVVPHMVPDQESKIVVDRTGVGLLILNAQLR